jgi:hypothetical protein
MAAGRMLEMSVRSWTVVAVAGQMMFALYLAVLYGAAIVTGNYAAWNRVMPRGYVAGDTFGNWMVGTHVMGALVILVAGALQITPYVRRSWPVFHRWLGRAYMGVAAVMSVGGLYLLWVKGTVGDVWQHLGTTLNALLILWFAAMALTTARARQFAEHRRWALRLYLVVAGVWFFRVGLMAWLLVWRAPVGFDGKTFTGPLLTALAFGQTLVPLAVLELYLRSKTPGAQRGLAVVLAMLTVVTAVGIVGATMGMWLPRM